MHWLRELGAPRGIKVAAVSGSLITDRVLDVTDTLMEDGRPSSALAGTIVSAEAYMGAEPIVDALKDGARIVITGRVADPSIFMAPMMREFGWDPLDHARVGHGSGIGHVLECGAQVTGGYFCDPGFKDMPEPSDLAFPIDEVESDGSAVIGKVPGTGGAINLRPLKEQLSIRARSGNYITPDVVVDFTTTELEEVGHDRVRVSRISGKPRRPPSRCRSPAIEGFIGEDMFFYAGPGALRRAELAKRILEERFRIVGLEADDLRIDFVGLNAIQGGVSPNVQPKPYEIAVRVAARTRTREEAAKVGHEVDGMAVSGVGMTGKRVPHQDRRARSSGSGPRSFLVEEVRPVITMYKS